MARAVRPATMGRPIGVLHCLCDPGRWDGAPCLTPTCGFEMTLFWLPHVSNLYTLCGTSFGYHPLGGAQLRHVTPKLFTEPSSEMSARWAAHLAEVGQNPTLRPSQFSTPVGSYLRSLI